MGKLELEAKDETAGILKRRIGRLREYSGLLVLGCSLGVC
jgi:hypothetical protein